MGLVFKYSRAVVPVVLLDRRWKAPLLPIVFHPIEKIVPWSPYFDIEPTFGDFSHLGKQWKV